MTPKAYTTAQACELLCVSKWKLYRMETAGEITSVQFGGPGSQKLWHAAPIDARAAELDPTRPKPRTPEAYAWRNRKRSA